MRERPTGDSQLDGEALRSRRIGLRWLAGAIAVTLAGAITFATASAGASTTVNAELSLSGIATSANILGGSAIGVHPGDTVNFTPSTIPTAGLGNIPELGPALDSLLQTILSKTTGYQITLHLPSTFPGGKRDVTMGACTSTKNLAVTFPTKGDYTFTWSAVAISPLCLLPANIGSLAGNQLKSAGVALNASNQWVADIHVATNATAGGISIQLPGVSLAPSVPVLGQLGTVGVPGLNLPTLGVSIPAIGGGGSTGAGAGSSSPGSGGYTYTPPAISIPQEVLTNPAVHNGGGSVGGDLGGSFGNALPSPQVTSTAPAYNASSAVADTSVPAKASASKKAAQLASSKPLTSTQMPVLLAIIAIVALALVSGTYARLYLIRQNG